MNYPPNSNNKNKPCTAKHHCPISPAASESIKKLAESVDDLTSAAAKMSASEECPEFLQVRAWQRADRVGRVLDNLLDNWEEQTCTGLCFDCAWQDIERSLAIINTLTPCNQWFAPEIWNYMAKKENTGDTDSE